MQKISEYSTQTILHKAQKINRHNESSTTPKGERERERVICEKGKQNCHALLFNQMRVKRLAAVLDVRAH